METDVIKLIESNYDVNILSGIDIFTVKFPGPKDTSYEGGTWKIRVFLPEKYPFQAPKIGFVNKVFHPNIDEASGVICLDVIDEAWSALYDLREVFRNIFSAGGGIHSTGSNSLSRIQETRYVVVPLFGLAYVGTGSPSSGFVDFMVKYFYF